MLVGKKKEEVLCHGRHGEQKLKVIEGQRRESDSKSIANRSTKFGGKGITGQRQMRK